LEYNDAFFEIGDSEKLPEDTKEKIKKMKIGKTSK
jgi:hypothetical protein